MIIAEMKGGLGNQMFQYAFAKSLALRNNASLKIDATDYVHTVGDPKKGIRLFGLRYFNIEAGEATAEDLQKFSPYRSAGFLGSIRRYLNTFGDYRKKKFIIEPKDNFFSFDGKMISQPIKEDVYVSGFWQSEEYFRDYSEAIRKQLSVAGSPEGKNKEALEKIKEQNSVAIHVRHGDNATAIAKSHGVLPMDFYKKAIEQIKNRVSDPVFYVFSDDIEWAKENLPKVDAMIAVDWNGDDKNHEDMRLMSACKHHIIANSTFSWWGAWLGFHKDQLVFAPKKYHQEGTVERRDFYPKTWNIL